MVAREETSNLNLGMSHLTGTDLALLKQLITTIAPTHQNCTGKLHICCSPFQKLGGGGGGNNNKKAKWHVHPEPKRLS